MTMQHPTQHSLFGDYNLPPAPVSRPLVAPKARKTTVTTVVTAQLLLEPAAAPIEPVEQPTISLFGYQVNVLNRAFRAIKEGHDRVLVHMPTGAGKTVLMARLVQRMIDAKKPVLIVAHRKELVSQAIKTLKKFKLTDDEIGIINADSEMDPGQKKMVYVASKDSLIKWIPRRSGPKTCDLSKFALVLIDEAHRSAAGTYSTLFGEIPVMGLTATPIRNGGKGLGDLYSHFILGPTLSELTAIGRLVPVRYFVATQIISPEMLEAAERGDDFDQSVISADIEARRLDVFGDVVKAHDTHARGRSTMLFAPSVAVSEGFVQMFKAAGVTAAHLDGSTPKDERERVIEEFAAGEIQLISSVDIFTEGFDCPSVGAVILCRPTKSRIFHLQSIGRGLRSEGEFDDCIVLDHVGNVARLGPVELPQPWEAEGWKLAEGSVDADKEQAARKKKVRSKKCSCPTCAATIDFPVRRQQQIPGLGWRSVLIGQETVDGHPVTPAKCPQGHPMYGTAIPHTCSNPAVNEAGEPVCTHTSEFSDGLRTCIRCGYVDIREIMAALARTHDAEIMELDPRTLGVQFGGQHRDQLEEMRRWWAGLQMYSQQHGEEQKRAAGRFRGRFGMWPSEARVQGTPPRPIDADIKAWITSQRIAWRSRRRDENTAVPAAQPAQNAAN